MALRQSKSKVVHSELLLSDLLREFENEEIEKLFNVKVLATKLIHEYLVYILEEKRLYTMSHCNNESGNEAALRQRIIQYES